MPKLIWEKKLQESHKCKGCFSWPFRFMKVKFFVQKYYQYINKKVKDKLLIITIKTTKLSLSRVSNSKNFLSKISIRNKDFIYSSKTIYFFQIT